ncbi:MAG: TonB-dependent receptor [Deltaproteobacteria bacterium]|nr:TonB-dependent receptor [Deltaproteobacteria bacterium]
MNKTRAFALIAASIILSPVPASAFSETSEVSISTGKRVDNLDWNIAGPTSGQFVNVRSELTWSDIESHEVRIGARIFLNRYFLKGEAGYGFITDGQNQDSDFMGNDRTDEFSRSNNSADDGSVWDLSGGLGYLYQFPALGGKFDLIPMAGLSYHKQNLTITEGVQTIDTVSEQLGPFSGLNSTYEAGWGGPWAGVDLAYQRGNLKLFGGFDFHVVYYRAEANWNLRTDFAHPVSFEHWATGTGIVFSAGGEYNLSQRWSLTASFKASDFRASDGTDRTYFSDGTAGDTPLNEVNWDSRSAFFGLNYRF